MTDEFRASLYRGIFHAVLVGLFSFFTLWTDPTVSVRTLVSASMIPALTVLGTRFIGEGWYDTKKAQAAARQALDATNAGQTPKGG